MKSRLEKLAQSKLHYVGNKRASIAVRELGSSLKRLYHARQFGGDIYLFEGATYNASQANGIASLVHARKGKSQITRDGKLFVVWGHY